MINYFVTDWYALCSSAINSFNDWIVFFLIAEIYASIIPKSISPEDVAGRGID